MTRIYLCEYSHKSFDGMRSCEMYIVLNVLETADNRAVFIR